MHDGSVEVAAGAAAAGIWLRGHGWGSWSGNVPVVRVSDVVGVAAVSKWGSGVLMWWVAAKHTSVSDCSSSQKNMGKSRSRQALSCLCQQRLD
jgi:hypothetical protein